MRRAVTIQRQFVSSQIASPSRFDSCSKSGGKVRDRHIKHIDFDRYSICSSTSSDKSSQKAKSYQNFLEECLLLRTPVRQFTIQRASKLQEQCTPIRKHRMLSSKLAPHLCFKINGWRDNYYTNLMDWSYNNFICAANSEKLNFFNMVQSDQFEAHCRTYFVPNEGRSLSSVRFSPFETKISLGYVNGQFVVYDYLKEGQVFAIRLHDQRVAALSWSGNTIITGSKDNRLMTIDARSFSSAAKFPQVHSQEICGVEQYGNLVASGGNDNHVFVYDQRKADMILDTYKHSAAVKAIAWLPRKGVLVTGGGTKDRKLKFWKDGENVYKEVDSGSQVCTLTASKNTQQIVSGQGYSLNQIVVWSHEGERLSTIHGHSNRVLYSALSPSGEYLASGAGDQMLKLWKLFPSEQKESLTECSLR